MIARLGVSSFALLLSILAAAPVTLQAQINGVPASVTSYGFGGNTNPNPGVRASVTSLGPTGYGKSLPLFGGWGGTLFIPSGSTNSFPESGRHHRGKHGNHAPLVIAEPAYIPYLVPVSGEPDEDSDSYSDDQAPADYIHAPRRRNPDSDKGRLALLNDPPSPESPEIPAPAPAEATVIPQPSTVLVFKDGHKSDVMNYAIVGDTLFDFGSGRTHKIQLADLDLGATQKANDDLGVDFQVPAAAPGH
jgi:hypothetical protein